MKKILYSILFVSMLVACESTTKTFGDAFTVKNPVSINEVLTQLKTNQTVNDVQIEGRIEKSCMSEGCWFTIKDAGGTEVLLDVKDKKFKVPTNSPGKTVVLLADAVQDSTSEQKVTLWVKGMMFK